MRVITSYTKRLAPFQLKPVAMAVIQLCYLPENVYEAAPEIVQRTNKQAAKQLRRKAK